MIKNHNSLKKFRIWHHKGVFSTLQSKIFEKKLLTFDLNFDHFADPVWKIEVNSFQSPSSYLSESVDRIEKLQETAEKSNFEKKVSKSPKIAYFRTSGPAQAGPVDLGV